MKQSMLAFEETERAARTRAPNSGTLTSRMAAEGIEQSMGRLQAIVLEFVVACGQRGATRDEIEVGLELAGNTVRPRVRELQRRGLVRVCEDTRLTRSGRAANVIRATR